MKYLHTMVRVTDIDQSKRTIVWRYFIGVILVSVIARPAPSLQQFVNWRVGCPTISPRLLNF